ncbi:hypothetical protein PENSUB_3610 [Penicillium subrubescens]|uniref:C2H2-type domain-containing protein n=2 Tax=Penicillium subrubescens TaxID=1316194 RepID=A0A1Q5UE91_9EURO|nr:hypothetical protein PENSUB_3610 [Penicillium subrubescens]
MALVICDVELSQGILCGKSYNTQGELRKHLRNQHPGAIEAITACPKSLDDMTNAIDALKRWCLTGGGRQAIYYPEPGYAPKNSLIQQFCDALERIAQEDPSFGQKWGTQFHRRVNE